MSTPPDQREGEGWSTCLRLVPSLAEFRQRVAEPLGYPDTAIACLNYGRDSGGPLLTLTFGESQHLRTALAELLAAAVHYRRGAAQPGGYCYIAVEDGDLVRSDIDSTLSAKQVTADSLVLLRPWSEMAQSHVMAEVERLLRREYEVVLEDGDGYAHLLAKVVRRAPFKTLDDDWPPVRCRTVTDPTGHIILDGVEAFLEAAR